MSWYLLCPTTSCDMRFMSECSEGYIYQGLHDPKATESNKIVPFHFSQPWIRYGIVISSSACGYLQGFRIVSLACAVRPCYTEPGHQRKGDISLCQLHILDGSRVVLQTIRASVLIMLH